MKTTVRYRIERRCFRDPADPTRDIWIDQSIAGTHTLKHARESLRVEKLDSPSYFERADFRIMKITTTREVVK